MAPGEGPASAVATGAAAGTQYRKLNHREHVLLRPGMYVGSIEPDECPAWVYDEAAARMALRPVRYVPALLKIFDEILMNAIDHAVRLKQQGAACKLRNIKVTIDRAAGGAIEVHNDGEGIDVEMHAAEGVYIPELIFGHLLTSANYNDDEEGGGSGGEAAVSADDASAAEAGGSGAAAGGGRIIGGQNGIGAKACNIFSTLFQVETVDRARKRSYRQAFRDNMSVVEAPVVGASGARKPYTTIRFVPDYARFGMPQGLTDDMYAMMVKRVVDATAVTDPDVAVFLNGARIECKTFERYADLYLGGKAADGGTDRAYEKINDRWEVVVAPNADGGGLQHVSFVNGMWTLRGGKHVDHVVQQVCKKLADAIASSRRGKKDAAAGAVRPQFIRDNLLVLVKATIPNPTFDSQAKDTLTTPVAKFGCKVEVSDRLIDKLAKNADLVGRVVSLSEASIDRTVKKTDGRKQSTVRGIPKLDDANWAGTAKSAQCTLILTEGDSAKTMAIAGLDQVGRDKWGVFPLRGKVMNVSDTSAARVADNAEIVAIKKILGLETGKTYRDVSELRYGRVMVMTDADADGAHIKGLLFNLFQQLWPSLLRVEGFMTAMLTPIVKARKGGVTEAFYNLSDFHAWREATARGAPGLRGWDIKYYKGLGTSTAAEAKEYFRRLKLVAYTDGSGAAAATGSATGGGTGGGPIAAAPADDATGPALDLAFNKKRANDRKAWLLGYDRDAVLDYGRSDVSFHEFVHRDLVHFSNYDVVRSIPSVCDGLKVSQRKILYCCFKRGLTKKEVRVAQLAGYVSEHAAYHHGEASLNATIIGMAQDFVGANNINLLQPNGMFGTRLHGGKDASAPRYIHTLLSPLARLLFPEDDDAVLRYTDDDGVPVEPEHYLPVLPLVLVNGALGIGTGFSTTVPCYDPRDVAAAVRRMLREADADGDADVADQAAEDRERRLAAAAAAAAEGMTPWYRGFTGAIQPAPSATATAPSAGAADEDGGEGGGVGGGGKYVSRGVWARVGAADVRITELPIGCWTEDFKAALEQLVDARDEVKAYRSACTETRIDFTVTFASRAAADAAAAPGGLLERELRLVSNRFLSTRNMYLFSPGGRIKKYEGVGDILVDFFRARWAAYVARKAAVLRAMDARLTVLAAKARFVRMIVDGELQVARVSRADLEARLQALEFPRSGGGGNGVAISGAAEDTEGADASDVAADTPPVAAAAVGGGTYDYLTRLPIHTLTSDKHAELEAEVARLAGKRADVAATPEARLWEADLDAVLAAL